MDKITNHSFSLKNIKLCRPLQNDVVTDRNDVVPDRNDVVPDQNDVVVEIIHKHTSNSIFCPNLYISYIL